MTALALQTRRFVEMATPKLQTVYRWFLGALDALAEAKIRKAQNEINRCRRLLHHDPELAVKAVPNRRQCLGCSTWRGNGEGRTARGAR